MKSRLGPLSACLLATVLFAAPPDARRIPAEYEAMLKEHVGSWQTTGWMTADGEKKPIEATWECRAAGKGPGLSCVWHHKLTDGSSDTELELIGYDKDAGKLSFTRLHEDGTVGVALVDVSGMTMSRRWEFVTGGRKAVGVNHIVVRESGLWDQNVTIDVEGKRTREMSLTQKRVAGGTPASAAGR
jgi:hypothetical protein